MELGQGCEWQSDGGGGGGWFMAEKGVDKRKVNIARKGNESV